MEDLEEKNVSVTFKMTKSMKKEVDALMKRNGWNHSAFIRVAIKESLDRLGK